MLEYFRRVEETGEELISFAIGAADLRWIAEEASSREVSVSGVIQEAIDRFRHNVNLGKLLELAGGTEDITEAMLQSCAPSIGQRECGR